MRITTIFFLSLFSIIQSIGQTDTLINIVAAGDVNLGTSYPSTAYLPMTADAPFFLLEPAKDILKNATIAFCNLEGPFLNSGIVAKHCRDSVNCYVFKTPEMYFQCIADAGFNLFSLANNHIYDFGLAGVESTFRLINSYKLNAAGTTNHSFCKFELNGIRYGFTAFSPINGTNSINDYSVVKEIVTLLKSESDIVIVSFHGGAEGKNYQHVPKVEEIFLGENRGNVFAFSKMAIDCGADVVIGHGPHVPRGVYLYKNRFIAFSLGNFCTYGRINVSGVNGYAPLIDIFVNKKGQFVKGKIHSFIQDYGSGISIDSSRRAALLMRKLSSEDFPDSPLVIGEDGSINLK
jgi:hypothetical protein